MLPIPTPTSREALYQELWTRPIPELLNRYGVCELTFLTTCRRLHLRCRRDISGHGSPRACMPRHRLVCRPEARRCKRPDASQAPPSKTDIQTSRAVFAAPWFRKQGM